MSRRTERLNKAIQQEISRLLRREVNDPRLSNLISVTRVSVSPDLKHAKVFISTIGDEAAREEILVGFNAASSFLRREIASRLQLRYALQLSFHYDDSIERGAKVLELIRQIDNSAHPDA